MFDRILVPLDRSTLAESVIPHVISVSKAFNSRIFLLSVLDAQESAQQISTIDPLDWQIQKAEAEAYLQRKAAQLQESGLQTVTQLAEGKAEEKILEFADNQSIDLIILSSHGQSGLTGWNVSSVVQKIILRAYISTLIVRAYQPGIPTQEEYQYRRLFVPLDGSQRAESVLPAAIQLASFYDAELLVTHVVPRPEMPRRTPPTQEDIHLSERISERNRVEALKYLEDLRNRLQVKVQTRLQISDHVTATLHDLAKEEGTDMVLLSAHGYSGETRWPFGSVVISFIAYGTTPLLIFQDTPKDQLLETEAEIAAREYGKRS